MSKAVPLRDFSYQQTTPSAVWEITHGIEFPGVDVYVDFGDGLEKIIAQEVENISNGVTRITFSGPMTGVCVIRG